MADGPLLSQNLSSPATDRRGSDQNSSKGHGASGLEQAVERRLLVDVRGNDAPRIIIPMQAIIFDSSTCIDDTDDMPTTALLDQTE